MCLSLRVCLFLNTTKQTTPPPSTLDLSMILRATSCPVTTCRAFFTLLRVLRVEWWLFGFCSFKSMYREDGAG